MVKKDDTSPSVDKFQDARSAEPRATPASPSSWGLFAAGLALCLAGIALVFAPFASPAYGAIANSIARRGTLGVAVAIGGLLLLGLYDLSRSQRRIANALNEEEEEVEETEPNDALHGIAGDVALVRGGIQELRVELVYLKDALRAAQERGGETGDGQQQDAMFRLAASLDQLGARVEQRLKTQHLDVQDTLLEIHNVVHGLRAQVAEISGGATQAGEAHETKGDFEPRIEIESEPTRDAADADRGPGRETDEELARALELEEERRKLGLLDSLDDFGQLLPDHTSPSGTAADARGGTGRSGADGEPASVFTHLQDSRGGRELDLDVELKLEQLKELLADSAVRDALESLRRNA